MSPIDSDGNLLFGALAAQLDLISADQLVGALNAWMLAKSKGLDEILVEQGVLTTAERSMIASLVDHHIQRHAGDVKQSLASVKLQPDIQRGLASISAENPVIDGTLASLAGTVTRGEAELTDDDGLMSTLFGPSISTGQRFQVLRHHAEGGLGVVSVALDTELKREVAFKEIKDSRADEEASRGRFVLEAEVTGRLEHPCVVPVYGFGRYGNGRPFYAMRFIRGQTLKEAVSEFHERRGEMDEGQRNIAFRDLLNRFVDVCQAVEYAHSRGVIHRDIKPENVMLGKYGETLLVDWGLAKLTGDASGGTETSLAPLSPSEESGSAETMAGTAIGTPHYMPPEQAEGRLDLISSQSDVYALGGTLATILSGKVPVEGERVQQVVSNVRNGRILPRHAAPEGVPKALWAVCNKAMAVTPADRYTSARELAEEVGRYLADEPVSARPDPFTVRAKRWARKHPSAVSGMAVTTLLLIVFFAIGFGVVTSYNRELDVARDRAEDNFEAAREAVEEYLVVVTENEKLKQADFTDLRNELLQAASPFYERLRDQKPGDEQVESGRANAMYQLAYIQHLSGQREQARKSYEDSLRIYQELNRNHPDELEYQYGAARGYRNLGVLLHQLGETESASVAYRTAVQLSAPQLQHASAEARHHSNHAKSHYRLGLLLSATGDNTEAGACYDRARMTLVAALDGFPNDVEVQSVLGDVLISKAWLSSSQNQWEDAMESYDSAGELFSALADESPLNPRHRNDLARVASGRAWCLKQLQDWDAAREQYREATSIMDSLAQDFPKIPLYRGNLAQYQTSLAILLREQRDFDGARRLFNAAIEIREELVADFPDVPGYREKLANVYHDFSNLLDETGGAQEYKTLLLKAVAIRESLIADIPDVVINHQHLATHYYGMGNRLKEEGDVVAAEEWYLKAIEIRAELAAKHPEVPDYRFRLANSYNNMGTLLEDNGEWRRAQEYHRENLKVLEALTRDFPELPQYAVSLGGGYCNFGNAVMADGNEEQIKWYHRAEETLSGVLEKHDDIRQARRFLSFTYLMRANAYRRLFQFENAVRDSQNAIEVSDDNAFRVRRYADLGRDLASLRRFDEAEDAFATALQIDAEAPIVHYRRGECFLLQGEHRKAAAAFRGAVEADGEYHWALQQLAWLYLDLGDFRQAVDTLNQVRDLIPDQRDLEGMLRLAERGIEFRQLLASESDDLETVERMVLIEYCRLPWKQLHFASAQQYRKAFRSEPKLVANPAAAPHRYDAACAAVRAAAGEGNDSDQLTGEEKSQWRQQALEWLQADLEIRIASAASEDPEVSGPAVSALKDWLSDPDLASVREQASLEQLPEQEHRNWESLWQQVNSVPDTELKE